MTDAELRCPACGAPIAGTDTFCEACGAQVGAGEAAPDPAADTAAKTTVVADTSAGGVCEHCGGEILDDGFCGTCGQKARSPRDHWSEQPAPWVGGVCDKGVVHPANEDAMALAADPDGGFAVVVVCDGVTSAPHSDRAAMAAARAACGLLSGVPRRRRAVLPRRSAIGPARWRRRRAKPTVRRWAWRTRWATRPSLRRARSWPRSSPTPSSRWRGVATHGPTGCLTPATPVS